MKRAAAFILFIAAIASLSVGCTPADRTHDKPVVVCTLFVPYDFAREIAGEAADVKLLLAPGVESHSYEPTAADMIAIADADLLICVGGAGEAWVERVLKATDTPPETLRLNSCSDGAPYYVIDEDHDEGEEHDESEEHGEHADEHIWLSPVIARKMASAVAGALDKLLPEDSGVAERAAKLDEKLAALDGEYREWAATPRTVALADSFPFAWFAGEYGVDFIATSAGCGDDAEPSAAALAAVIDAVKEKNLPAVYKLEFSSSALADNVAETTGAEVRTLYACHTVSSADLKAGVTYVELMERNLAALTGPIN